MPAQAVLEQFASPKKTILLELFFCTSLPVNDADLASLGLALGVYFLTSAARAAHGLSDVGSVHNAQDRAFAAGGHFAEHRCAVASTPLAGTVAGVTASATTPTGHYKQVLHTPPLFLAGAAAVSLVLALSRWGTNMGFSPLFITDVLIAASLVHLSVTHLNMGSRITTGWVPRSTPTLLFRIFFVYILARFTTSVGNAPGLDWLRDGVPFLYGVMAFIGARALAVSAATTRDRTMRVIWSAMIIHLVWTAFVVLTDQRAGFTAPAPFFAAPVFQLRPDIDAALIAVAVGMLLRHTLTHKRKFLALVALVLGIVTVFSLGTRAGLLSLFVALAVSFFITFASLGRKDGRRILLVMLVPAVVITLSAILPFTVPGQRMLATISPSSSYGEVQDSATGTQRARALTWTTIIEWTQEDTARQVFGSGFGNDFLAESGTKAFLEGTTYENVRSPHNWFVGIYARMGLIGTLIAVAVILELGSLISTNRKRIGSEPILAVSALIVCAILPVASLGVVLEAPFGAVPFFWAAGLLMTLARKSMPTDAASSLRHTGQEALGE